MSEVEFVLRQCTAQFFRIGGDLGLDVEGVFRKEAVIMGHREG